jgi:SH3-like domain-containing protein
VSRSLPLRPTAGAAILAILLASLGGLTPLTGQAAAQTTGSIGPSGLPLPRFVSLKSGRVNLRIGPGRAYAVDWMYLKPGLPMEIIQEYDNWRRVRDSEGTEGWINQSLLSGKRTAIAAPWNAGKDAPVALRDNPAEDARVVASVEPGVIGEIEGCDGNWCEVEFGGQRGWIAQAQIWGAYPGETVED